MFQVLGFQTPGFLCDSMLQEVVRGVVSDIQAQEQKDVDQVDKSRPGR